MIINNNNKKNENDENLLNFYEFGLKHSVSS